jgi:SNW domain-containing protein 1
MDSASTLEARIPPYGKRAGWKPRKPEDYGDGGAFPEIHIAQYPRDMGRKRKVLINTADQPVTWIHDSLL